MTRIKPLYNLSDYDYSLPEELIAQLPPQQRDASRLFVLDRNNRSYTHTVFSRITDFLRNDDILVFNDAKVIRARIYCRRESGGRIEIVLAARSGPCRWHVVCNRTARMREGEFLHPEKKPDIQFRVTGREGEYLIIDTGSELDDDLLGIIGEVPLPPYIKRNPGPDDSGRYQTVYASTSGAVAAPTAGLHFTGELLEEIGSRGIEKVFTTLHVSWGTFSPVRDNDISLHRMHSERYALSEDAASTINRGRASGRRIISVGTTALRVLESTFSGGINTAGQGTTEIFIYPPYQVKSADALLTNFHTPCSTLLMLVSAFAGYDTIMKAYDEAVRERYRFFSYGDAMLIV